MKPTEPRSAHGRILSVALAVLLVGGGTGALSAIGPGDFGGDVLAPPPNVNLPGDPGGDVLAPPPRVLVFPGCGETLQACIDATAPGDIVRIATDDPIDESLEFRHGLTLESAPGFTATLAPLNSIIAINEDDATGTFDIRGLKLERGRIAVLQGSTGRMTANVHGNVILDSFRSPVIEVRAGNVGGARGDIVFSIQDNSLNVPEPSSGDSRGISVSAGNSPTARGVISGNAIEMAPNSQGAAISLGNGVQALTVDVLSNVISGTNYNTGISLFQFADGGSTTARVINNLITGQNGNSGRPAAISVNGSRGTLDFTVLHNTIADNRSGLSIGGRADLGAVMSGVVASNIVAHSTNVGLGIDSTFDATISNSHNLVFASDRNFFTPGPGTLDVDPQFVGGGDFRLLPTSPAADAGANAQVPADIPTDLDGNPRIAGAEVDLGAFELPGGREPSEPPPEPPSEPADPEGCATAAECLDNLRSAIPPDTAGANKEETKIDKTLRKVRKFVDKLRKKADKAEAAPGGKKQEKKYLQLDKALGKFLAKVRKLEAKGRLPAGAIADLQGRVADFRALVQSLLQPQG